MSMPTVLPLLEKRQPRYDQNKRPLLSKATESSPHRSWGKFTTAREAAEKVAPLSVETRNRAAFTAAILCAFVGLTAIVGSFPLFSGASVAPSGPNVDSAALAGRVGMAVSSSIGTAEGPVTGSLSCAVAGVAMGGPNIQVKI